MPGASHAGPRKLRRSRGEETKQYVIYFQSPCPEPERRQHCCNNPRAHTLHHHRRRRHHHWGQWATTAITTTQLPPLTQPPVLAAAASARMYPEAGPRGARQPGRSVWRERKLGNPSADYWISRLGGVRGQRGDVTGHSAPPGNLSWRVSKPEPWCQTASVLWGCALAPALRWVGGWVGRGVGGRYV